MANGIPVSVNAQGLPVVPDIVVARERVAVYCGGHFWHGRDGESHLEKLRRGANPGYWVAKICRNMERDLAQSAELRRSGRRVIRFLESRILAGALNGSPYTHHLSFAACKDRLQYDALVLAPVAVDRSPSPPRSWAKTAGSPQVHLSDARDRRDGLRQARV